MLFMPIIMYSRMLFMFANGALSWRTKKQTTMALSSTEAEYTVAALVAKEGLWLNSILKELDVINLSHIKMYCDNQSRMKIVINVKNCGSKLTYIGQVSLQSSYET